MAIAASYDSTGRYGAQTPFSDNLGAYWGGGQWRVDSTHNAIIAVTNGGNRATDALLTLHFEDGKKNYEIQQMIQPGEQMWLNLADVIHHSAPDRKGNALPTDITSGTYDLEDLNPGLGGNLIEGKVVLDKTWGHLTYGCLTCCGYTPYLSPDPTGVGVGGDGGISALGTNNCTGVNGFSLHNYFNQSNARWWSGNTAIATVTSFNGHGVAPGTTAGSAIASVPNGDGGRPKPPCTQANQEGQNVISVCPSSTSVGSTTAESLAAVFPTYKTGLGVVVGIQVSPSAPTGLIVTETLSNKSNTCPQGFPTNVCTTNGNLNTSSLSVGTAGTAFDGTPLPATPNIMWDEHIVASSSNLLGSSGQQCSIQCNQQYSCGGTIIGNYTITYTFSTGTISGTPVTNVTATCAVALRSGVNSHDDSKNERNVVPCLRRNRRSG